MKRLFLFLMLVVLMSTMAFAVTNDAVSACSFDDDAISSSACVDEGDGGITWTSVGLTTGATGILEQAFSYDGANDYTYTSNYVMSSTSSYSVWFKTSTTATQAIIARRPSSSTDDFVLLTHTDNKIRLAPGSGGDASGSTTVDDGAWHHAVVTYNSGAWNVYVDGSCTPEITVGSSAIAGNSIQTRLGEREDGTTWDFTGEIDQYLYYDRVITCGEIGALYNGGAGLDPYAPAPAGLNGTDEFYIDELIHWYPLNDTNYGDTTGVLDNWGTNNGTGVGRTFYNANVSGATLSNASGVSYNMSSYYDFDGTNDEILALPQNNGEYTFAFWMNADDVTQTDLIVWNGDSSGSNPNTNVMFFTQSSLIKFRAGNGTAITTATESISSGTWHHIAGTNDGTTMKLFVDGINTDNVSFNSPVYTSAAELTFGADGSGGFDYAGKLDEVRIWDRVLEESDIKAEMVSNAPVENDGLVAYYGFNQNYSTTQTPDQNQLAQGYRYHVYEEGSPSYNFQPSTAFDRVDDVITLDEIKDLNDANNFTVSGWAYKETTQDGAFIYYETGNDRFSINYHSSGELRSGFYNGAAFVESSSGSFDLDQWNHFVYTYTPSNGTLWINGVAQTGTNDISVGSTDGTWIGARAGSANFLNGSLQDIRIYNKTLSPSNVMTLYLGLQEKYFVARDNITNATISDFNVTSSYGNATTTSGNVSLYVPQGDINVSYVVNNYNDRTNVQHIIINSTGTYYAQFYNADAAFNVGTAIPNRGFFLNLSRQNFTWSDSQSITSDTLDFDLSDGTYTATIYNSSTVIYTESVSIASGSSTTNLTGTFNVTVVDAINGTSLNVFNLTTYENGSVIEVLNTTSGNILAIAYPGTFLFEADAPGYALVNTTATGYTGYTDVVITLYRENSVNITFYEIGSSSVLTGVNISYDLLGASPRNRTTSVGFYLEEGLGQGDYTIRYDAPGYAESFFEFTVANRSNQTLVLYMENASTTDNVTITIIDELSQDVEGAVVKVLKYDPITGNYVTTESLSTNFEGQVVANIELSAEFYKFIVEYPAGTIKKTTDATYIYETSVTIPIVLAETVLETYYRMDGVAHNLTFNDATDNFKLLYSDSQGTAYQACIELYNVTGTLNTLISTTCNLGSSGQVLVSVTDDNFTAFRADAYLYISSTSDGTYLSSQIQDFGKQSRDEVDFLFLGAMVTMAVFIGLLWAPAIAVTLLPTVYLLMAIMGLVTINVGIMIGLQLIFLIIGVWLGRQG